MFKNDDKIIVWEFFQKDYYGDLSSCYGAYNLLELGIVNEFDMYFHEILVNFAPNLYHTRNNYTVHVKEIKLYGELDE